MNLIGRNSIHCVGVECGPDLGSRGAFGEYDPGVEAAEVGGPHLRAEPVPAHAAQLVEENKELTVSQNIRRQDRRVRYQISALESAMRKRVLGFKGFKGFLGPGRKKIKICADPLKRRKESARIF
jgi:hypothetical protein